MIFHSLLRYVVDYRVLNLFNNGKRLDTDFTQSQGHSNLFYKIKTLSEVLETIFLDLGKAVGNSVIGGRWGQGRGGETGTPLNRRSSGTVDC